MQEPMIVMSRLNGTVSRDATGPVPDGRSFRTMHQPNMLGVLSFKVVAKP